jgi:hypothetical protein
VARVRVLPLLAAAAAAVALGGCGGSSDEPSSSSATTAANSTTAAVTPTRKRLEQELRRLLESGDSVDVDCVIKELRSTLSNELVEAATDAAAQDEDIPKEAVDAAYAAGQRCSQH